MECGKIKFSLSEAHDIASTSKKEYKKWFGNTVRQEKRVYFCRSCNAYHLTSMSQKEWEQIRPKRKKWTPAELKELLKQNNL